MELSAFIAEAKRLTQRTAYVEIDRAFGAVEAFRSLADLAPNSPAYRSRLATANAIVELALDRVRAARNIRHIAVAPFTDGPASAEYPDVTEYLIDEIRFVEQAYGQEAAPMRKSA